MAPSTRSRAPAATSSSPLYLRMKAEAKKDYETHGKTRRNAMPQAIRSSVRKAAVAESTRAAPATRATTSGISIPTADTSFTRSTKRKCDATEEDKTIAKKQKVAASKQSSAEKRKRTEDDSIAKEVNTPRQVKKLRSTASKAKVVKKEEKEVVETTTARSSRVADKAKKSRSSTIRPTTLSKIGGLDSFEGLPLTSSRCSNDLNEVITEGSGFFYSRTTFAFNEKASASKATKANNKGKQATKGSFTKVKKEERKGEMEIIRKGEQDKKEEIKGRLVNRSLVPSPSSQRIKNTTKASTSRPARRDLFYVEGDYDTETGELLSDNDDDNLTDSDEDLIDSDLDDSDLDDSDLDDSDSDSDLAPTPTLTPSSSTRPSSTLKKPSTASNTSEITTSDADDDTIPTICSEGIQREEAGLPSVQEEEDSKGQRKPILAEFTDYGNGEYEFFWTTEERKVKTAEEKKNRTKLERQNDRMVEHFYDTVDSMRKRSVKRAMRNYKPVNRKAIE